MHPIRWFIKSGTDVRSRHSGYKLGYLFIGLTPFIFISILYLYQDNNRYQMSAFGQPETQVETFIDSNKQSDAAISEPPTALTSEQALLAINAMVKDFPGMSTLRIKSITSPINGVLAVAIEPPYREFPNVVFFQYDNSVRRWKRVSEALCIGIQSEVSKILDLHTTGYAADILQPASAEDRRKLLDVAASSGMVIVSYQGFAHMHPSGRETYYIDKQVFSRLAKQLINVSPDDTCALFYIPTIIGVSLSHDSGVFKLTARTSNNQEWMVTFTGIAGGGRLDQKVISAKSIEGKALR